jgi:hypothetical protein
MSNLRINSLGFAGCILAVVSVAFPWWVGSFSGVIRGNEFGNEVILYLYRPVTAMGTSGPTSQNPWCSSIALAFVAVGALLGLLGSVNVRKRRILVVGGILILFSVGIFAAGLQEEISSGTLPQGYPTSAGLFSNGSYKYFGVSTHCLSYLSLGFWLALAAAIIILAASVRPAS